MPHSMLLALLIPISDVARSIVISKTAGFHDTRLHCKDTPRVSDSSSSIIARLVIIKYSTHQPSITRRRHKLRNERNSNFHELTLQAQNVAPERLNLFGFASSNWIMLRLGKLSISLDDDLLPSLCRVAAGSLEAPNANSSWKSCNSFGSET